MDFAEAEEEEARMSCTFSALQSPKVKTSPIRLVREAQAVELLILMLPEVMAETPLARLIRSQREAE